MVKAVSKRLLPPPSISAPLLDSTGRASETDLRPSQEEDHATVPRCPELPQFRGHLHRTRGYHLMTIGLALFYSQLSKDRPHSGRVFLYWAHRRPLAPYTEGYAALEQVAVGQP